MKVFISWSGITSHKVAIILRDWLPSVIQTIEPYVSSEDIDKGARWSTDIAAELENSTFGILCVTRENLYAPWLLFEAGALSKTIDKSFVSPFLFDIKYSDVKGPLLQFQSTIFQKNDIKKLLRTLNKASGTAGILDDRLDKTFDVWYPTLEDELNKLLNVPSINNNEEELKISKSSTSEILEEILDLARNNQKLLRNPEQKTSENIEFIKKTIKEQSDFYDKSNFEKRLMANKYHAMFSADMIHSNLIGGDIELGFLISLSLFKQDFPWVYDLGKELLQELKLQTSKETKLKSIREFEKVFVATIGHPLVMDIIRGRENIKTFKELPYIMHSFLEHLTLRYT